MSKYVIRYYGTPRMNEDESVTLTKQATDYCDADNIGEMTTMIRNRVKLKEMTVAKITILLVDNWPLSWQRSILKQTEVS